MWIIAVDIEFYPWVEEHETYKEAREAYDRYEKQGDLKVYLAKVEKESDD